LRFAGEETTPEQPDESHRPKRRFVIAVLAKNEPGELGTLRRSRRGLRPPVALVAEDGGTMRWVFVCSFTALLAAAAVVAVPATARAETSPHWFANRKLVGSEGVPVRGKGLILVRRPFNGSAYRALYECRRIRDREMISNPPGGGPGIGETVAVQIRGCVAVETQVREPGICGSLKLEVIPQGLPWHLRLARETPNHVSIVFEGVAMEIRCKKSPRGVFSGALHDFFTENSSLFGEEGERITLANGSERQEFQISEGLTGPTGSKRISVA
jgi:hypothetical protein